MTIQKEFEPKNKGTAAHKIFKAAVDEKPIEFKKEFDNGIKDKIMQKIADRKQEMINDLNGVENDSDNSVSDSDNSVDNNDGDSNTDEK